MTDRSSEPEGMIFVSLDSTPDEITMRAVDRGLGIDTEFLPRIFDLFVQWNCIKAPWMLSVSAAASGVRPPFVFSIAAVRPGTPGGGCQAITYSGAARGVDACVEGIDAPPSSQPAHGP
jgi:hypothetical protein